MGRALAFQAGEASSSLAACSIFLLARSPAAKTLPRHGRNHGFESHRANQFFEVQKFRSRLCSTTIGSDVAHFPAFPPLPRGGQKFPVKHERYCDFGPVAHLGERLPCTQEAVGSSPIRSTIPKAL